MNVKKLRAVVGAITVLLATASAQATLVKVSEPMPDDTGNTIWTVDISGIAPGGSCANGVFQVPATVETITFSYCANSNLAATFSQVYNIWDDAAFTVLSDIVRISGTAGSRDVVVRVDSNDGLMAVVGGIDILETTGFMQIAQIGRVDGTFDDIQLQSDPEPVHLPEPAGIALIGIAGLALAASRRQRGTNAAA